VLSPGTYMVGCTQTGPAPKEGIPNIYFMDDTAAWRDLIYVNQYGLEAHAA